MYTYCNFKHKSANQWLYRSIGNKLQCTGYIGNEEVNIGITIPQRLRSLNIGKYVSGWIERYTFMGDGNWSFSSNWKNNNKPLTTLPAKAEIIITPTAYRTCFLDIPYTIPTGCTLTVSNNRKFIVQGNLRIQ